MCRFNWQSLRQANHWPAAAATHSNRSHQVHRQRVQQSRRGRSGISPLRTERLHRISGSPARPLANEDSPNTQRQNASRPGRANQRKVPQCGFRVARRAKQTTSGNSETDRARSSGYGLALEARRRDSHRHRPLCREASFCSISRTALPMERFMGSVREKNLTPPTLSERRYYDS